MTKHHRKMSSIELDAGWCAAAGFSPVEFVKKHSGRVKLIHIKESSRVIGTDKPGEDTKEINCPAGLGLVDWKVLKDAADVNGCEAYIVEREHSYEGTRTQCLKAGLRLLQPNTVTAQTYGDTGKRTLKEI